MKPRTAAGRGEGSLLCDPGSELRRRARENKDEEGDNKEDKKEVLLCSES